MRPNFLLPLLLCAPACFLSRDTINQPIVQQKLGTLVPGTSTASQVVETLGAPSEVVQLGKNTAYRYDFTTIKRAGFSIIIVTFLNQDTCQDRVWLFFDTAGVLTHMGATLDADKAEYVMPWMETHKG
jgi:outer membrane protein assembly factor BamE (lipoprotein component of BamABCDE complex)